MSLADEHNAQRALAHYLIEWGVPDAPTKARKFIDELTARGWQMAPEKESRPRPPRADETCQGCYRHLDHCICGERRTKPHERVPANEEWRRARQRALANTEDEVA